MSWYSSLSSRSLGITSIKARPNSPPSFIGHKSSIKRFVKWQYQALILVFE